MRGENGGGIITYGGLIVFLTRAPHEAKRGKGKKEEERWEGKEGRTKNDIRCEDWRLLDGFLRVPRCTSTASTDLASLAPHPLISYIISAPFLVCLVPSLGFLLHIYFALSSSFIIIVVAMLACILHHHIIISSTVTYGLGVREQPPGWALDRIGFWDKRRRPKRGMGNRRKRKYILGRIRWISGS